MIKRSIAPLLAARINIATKTAMKNTVVAAQSLAIATKIATRTGNVAAVIRTSINRHLDTRVLQKIKRDVIKIVKKVEVPVVHLRTKIATTNHLVLPVLVIRIETEIVIIRVHRPPPHLNINIPVRRNHHRNQMLMDLLNLNHCHSLKRTVSSTMLLPTLKWKTLK